jgi:P-type Ca2+ transporter type 2C
MERGLTAQEAKELLSKHGKNEIVYKKHFKALKLFLSQFPSVINGILIAAAAFSFLIKEVLDGVFILSIIFLSAVFGFIQEYRAEKALEKLKSYVKPLSRVIRDGKEIQVETSELVPGDLVIITAGDYIPADGKLVLNHNIEADESVLTGESLPVAKKLNDNVFSGTVVAKGRGRFLVEKTGLSTRFGQIAHALEDVESEKTPLQKRLSTLGKILSLIAVVIATSLIPIGLEQGKEVFTLILIAVSVAVAAIPEGLPAVLTIAQSIGTARMVKNNALVRKMNAIETLGSVQIILSDKTGTLTTNEMRVKEYFLTKNGNLKNILLASVFGNTASLVQKQNRQFDVVGDKTDGALLLWANKIDKNINTEKNKGKVVDEYVFDPKTKTITTIVRYGRTNYVYVRGSTEEIISKTNLSDKERLEIEKKIAGFANAGLRIIGFGLKIDGQKHFEFLGFVGIYDPPRKEARDAVARAKEAGIQTIMVTGDNKLTAVAIAKEVGLIEKNEDVVEGFELDKIKDEELEKIILRTRVFARTTPEHKLRLVELLKKMGYVVAVTGDGVNDALALKRADVGIAMGRKGTDVAKEASDIILLDDNYASLISAIQEGRTIYQNILKAITYLLSSNFSDIFLIFFGILLGLPLPLLPTQILWINLVTDGLPAMALASDNRAPGILKQKPRNPNEPILTLSRTLLITTIGLTLTFGLLLVFYSLLQINYSETFSRTITFNLLVFSHLALAFLIRGRNMFRLNKFLVVSVLFTVLLQLTITTVPSLQKIFHLGF